MSLFASAVDDEAAFGINMASIPKAIAIIIASAIVLCDFFMKIAPFYYSTSLPDYIFLLCFMHLCCG